MNASATPTAPRQANARTSTEPANLVASTASTTADTSGNATPVRVNRLTRSRNTTPDARPPTAPPTAQRRVMRPTVDRARKQRNVTASSLASGPTACPPIDRHVPRSALPLHLFTRYQTNPDVTQSCGVPNRIPLQ